MIGISKENFSNWNKIPKINLINSCMGYKSANLIGTQSKDGSTNLAIFSSVTHLGSDPALLGFIVRPTTVPRHTYANIKETEYFTVNSITETMIEEAHHTSANYAKEISEFDKAGLSKEYLDTIPVPFVGESPLKLLCKYVNEYEIKENGTIQIIASIEKIYVDELLLQDDGFIQLDLGKVVSINGLDGYSVSQLVKRLPYARPIL
ncbi:MAG: flavin reductase family protein [Crocinitomicaceae bacterium]|nr:flavin reductase family protein [Crocinitomicaceae bacterium]MCF8445301.1 flavin reductase family protein [Crocinitomicaceae bacterium]